MRALLLAAALAGVPTAAQADTCLDLSRVTGPDVQRDGTLLYRQNGERAWRAELEATCPGLNRDARIAVTSSVSAPRICRGDRFRVLRPPFGTPGAVCRFARFVPVGGAAR